MLGLLFLPSELLYKIIQICSPRDRCHIRLTCKILKEHADPIVFRRLRLFSREPHVNEHQLIALATRSSRACELTKDVEVADLPDVLPAGELSWPHFGHCDDLRAYLPTAISALRNTTRFSMVIFDNDPYWLVDSFTQAVAHLPRLTELRVMFPFRERPRVPLGRFSNLSSLSVVCGDQGNVLFCISQMAITISNSPQLRSLTWEVFDDNFLPKLSELFAKLSTGNPLRLEHLHISSIDATLDGAILPHLTHLTSFDFDSYDMAFTVVRSVWTSFMVNNVKLSNMKIGGNITEEMMSYLLSFSGLKTLVVGYVQPPSTAVDEDLKNTLFEDVIPKHAISLQTLEVIGGSQGSGWVLNQASLKSIMKCLNLRVLIVCIDGNSMTVQHLLDTVVHLPELRVLQCFAMDESAALSGLASFKPSQGNRYMEKLDVNGRRFVLERDGEQRVRYCKCSREGTE